MNDLDARHLLALRAHPALANLDLAALGALAQIFDEELFPRGARLPPAIYFVLDGRIATRAGTITGGALGLVELFAGASGELEAVAETDVLALTAEPEAMLDLFEESFALLRATMVGVARQLLARRHEPIATARALPALPGRRLDLAERLEVLAGDSWLEGSRLEALFELGRVADEVMRDAGAVLWRRGEPADASWLLLEGTVDLVAPGLPAVAAAAGQLFGAVEALAEQSRGTDAVARTLVRALRIPAAGVLDVIEDEPDLGLDLLRRLAGAILSLDAR